ncbi:hypothetical protein AA0311_2158 [Asaia bogorensis NBRC 16594]|nr:hypothetical protein AA0311_2158 [Asaia bogorensis NBRC 16594]
MCDAAQLEGTAQDTHCSILPDQVIEMLGAIFAGENTIGSAALVFIPRGCHGRCRCRSSRFNGTFLRRIKKSASLNRGQRNIVIVGGGI